MNALFGLRVIITVGENVLVGNAVSFCSNAWFDVNIIVVARKH